MLSSLAAFLEYTVSVFDIELSPNHLWNLPWPIWGSGGWRASRGPSWDVGTQVLPWTTLFPGRRKVVNKHLSFQLSNPRNAFIGLLRATASGVHIHAGGWTWAYTPALWILSLALDKCFQPGNASFHSTIMEVMAKWKLKLVVVSGLCPHKAQLW